MHKQKRYATIQKLCVDTVFLYISMGSMGYGYTNNELTIMYTLTRENKMHDSNFKKDSWILFAQLQSKAYTKISTSTVLVQLLI